MLESSVINMLWEAEDGYLHWREPSRPLLFRIVYRGRSRLSDRLVVWKSEGANELVARPRGGPGNLSDRSPRKELLLTTWYSSSISDS